MKLTTARLKKLIREEMQKLNELQGAEKRELFNYKKEDIHVFLVNDMKNQNALSRIKSQASHGEQGFYVVNDSGDLRIELDKKYNPILQNQKQKYTKYFKDYFYVVGVTQDQFAKVNNIAAGTPNLLEKNQAVNKIPSNE
jgi:phosphomevalonate kinase